MSVADERSATVDASVAHALRNRPRDTNRYGHQAGWVLLEGRERAALFDCDRVVDIGLLHRHDDASRALALNDRAEVVGMSLCGRHEHAFIWRCGRIDSLGGLCRPSRPSRPRRPMSRGDNTHAPQRLQSSRARAINGSGQVVGRAATEDRVFGFVWSLDTGLLDLSELQPDAMAPHAWRIADALHIDDEGRILAAGVRDGRWHDVLLTPQPS